MIVKKNKSGPVRQRYRHWSETLNEIIEKSEPEVTSNEIDVGNQLRSIRNERGLSLRALADLSGLNFNTLSLIENDKSSPSVSTLQQVAKALQIPITAFFDVRAERKSVNFQKNEIRPKADFTHGTIEDLGSGLSLGEGAPLLMTLMPGSGSGDEPLVHTGQEFVYCLEGRFIYTIAGTTYHLEPGDSLIFEAHLPHKWENQESEMATRFILILCPAEGNDHSAVQHFDSGLT